LSLDLSGAPVGAAAVVQKRAINRGIRRAHSPTKMIKKKDKTRSENMVILVMDVHLGSSAGR
jgi:hypothetical protein